MTLVPVLTTVDGRVSRQQKAFRRPAAARPLGQAYVRGTWHAYAPVSIAHTMQCNQNRMLRIPVRLSRSSLDHRTSSSVASA